MLKKTIAILSSVLLSLACVTASSRAQSRPGSTTILWPSRSGEFPTIQSALDALPDGGVLEISQGEFHLTEPLFVTGKRVVIRGAGSGVKFKVPKKWKKPQRKGPRPPRVRTTKRATRLIGPPPQPVLDRSGSVILPAATVVGLFNFQGAGAVVRDIGLSGFDAGIVAEDDALGNSTSLTVENVGIEDTGRGIVDRTSGGRAVIRNSSVRRTQWHGIVKAAHLLPEHPPVLIDPSIAVVQTFLIDPSGAGLYFEDVPSVTVNDTTVYGGKGGGIVAVKCGHVSIYDNFISGGDLYGVLLARVDDAFLSDNFIQYIFSAGPPQYLWGDGIAIALSHASVVGSHTYKVVRAGLSNFGSYVSITDTLFQCANPYIYLQGAAYMGQDFEFYDGGGVHCGCPNATGYCIATAPLEPPEPVETVP